MTDPHDHSDEILEKICCGAEFLEQGIHKAMHRIEEKNAEKGPCLYSNEGEYEDILRDFLKNRQTRLSQINTERGDSWTAIEKAFTQLEMDGFCIARYMHNIESDFAECLLLMSESKAKAFVVYSIVNLLDEEKRLNLMLFSPDQVRKSIGTYCNGLSSDEEPEIFNAVMDILNKNGLPSQIGDYPGIIAVSGDWTKIDYNEIDNVDLDFHLEIRVGVENLQA